MTDQTSTTDQTAEGAVPVFVALPRQPSGPFRQILKKLGGPIFPPKPYGAERLAKTDLTKLQKSLEQQMLHADVPLPVTMNLHPDADWKDPFYVKQAQILGKSYDEVRKTNKDLIGDGGHIFPSTAVNGVKTYDSEVVGNTDPDAIAAMHRGLFAIPGIQGVPDVGKLSITLDEYNAMSALHETTHWTAAQLTRKVAVPAGTSGSHTRDKTTIIDLNDRVFDKIEGIKPQSATTHVADITAATDRSWEADTKDTPADEKARTAMEAATSIKASLSDRIADTGMALYALSNYSDTQQTKSVLQAWADVRVVDSSSDHDTASSIHAAIGAFEKNPRKGLSIVQTTKWAAKIIEQQPDLRYSPEQIVHNHSVRSAAAIGANQSHGELGPHELAVRIGTALLALPPTDKNATEIKNGVDAILTAKHNLDPSYHPVIIPGYQSPAEHFLEVLSNFHQKAVTPSMPAKDGTVDTPSKDGTVGTPKKDGTASSPLPPKAPKCGP